MRNTLSEHVHNTQDDHSDHSSEQWALTAPMPSFAQSDTGHVYNTQYSHSQQDHSSDQWALAAPMPSFMQSDTSADDSTIKTWLPATILRGGDCSMIPWPATAAPSMLLPAIQALHINGHHYHHTPTIYSNIHSISPIKHTNTEAWGEE